MDHVKPFPLVHLDISGIYVLQVDIGGHCNSTSVSSVLSHVYPQVFVY